MKALLFLFAFALSTSVSAATKSGSCVMGSGENAVKVLLTITESAVQLSYEGSEEDKTDCTLGRNSNYDYYITCDGEDDEDDMIVRVKGSSGAMVDFEGTIIARLSQCRIR